MSETIRCKQLPAFRTLAVAALGAPLLLLAGGCHPASTCTASQLAKNPPIKIGVSIQQTGTDSPDGVPTLQGYQLWADSVNANGGLLCRSVQLDVLDNGSSDTQLATDVTTLISVHHDDFVLGPFAHGVPAGQSAAPYGYGVLVTDGAHSHFTQGLTNIFSTALSSANTITIFTSYILSLPTAQKPATAVYATEQHPYLQPITEQGMSILSAGGITTAIPEIVYPAGGTATDWAPVAQQIINANADVVVLGTLTDDAIYFVNQFKAVHYNPKALIEISGPDQGATFTSGIGGSSFAEGIFVPNPAWYPGIPLPGEAAFEAAYIAKFGGTAQDISQDSVQSYAAAQVLEQAVTKVGSTDQAKFIAELRSDTFQTLQGPVKFDSNGEDALAEAILFQWQSGALIPSYPTQVSTHAPEYPKATW